MKIISKQTKSRKLTWVGLGLLSAFGIAILHGCDSLFFRPNSEIYTSIDAYGDHAESIQFRAEGGPQLHGWWLEAKGDAHGTVVYCHGNSHNLTLHAQYIDWLPSYGYNVLLVDYRGYGASQGEPTREGCVADAIAAIDFALDRDPHRTLVFGHSLGGAIAIVAASERPAVRAVVAECSFPSYREIAQAKAPWISWLVPLFVTRGYEPKDALANLPPRPLLVIHSTDDHIVPFALGESLFTQALEPKQFYRSTGAGHFTPWTVEGEAFEMMLTEFFRESLDN